MDSVMENVLSMFAHRHMNKVKSILHFLISLPEIKLSASGHILLDGQQTHVHVSDFITDMMLTLNKPMPDEYKEIYNILHKHGIPNKLLTNKSRRMPVTQTVIQNEDDPNVSQLQQKWEKF